MPMTFEDMTPELWNHWTYKGEPCTVRKVGKVDNRIRAVYVKLFDDTPEFVHIGLERDAFQDTKSDKVA